MSKKKEYMKRSEARIIIYLNTVENKRKNGSWMCAKLEIDYIYIMKLLREMYKKGWVKVHQYQDTSYFEITEETPLKYAKELLSNKQTKINKKYAKIRQ